MRNPRKITKSFSLDSAVGSYVLRTKGKVSASARVNQLLQRAIREEQYERLEQEAAEFFGDLGEDERKEARAFQKAALRSLARD